MSYIPKMLFRVKKYTNPSVYRIKINPTKEYNILDRLNVLNGKQTIDYLVDSGKSLVRWGSGETDHYLGGQNPTQEFDFELSKELSNILHDYNSQSPYLLAIPSIYIQKSHDDFFKQKKIIINQWNKSRHIFGETCNAKLIYGDAFVFRHERGIDYRIVSKLWENKHVILIAPESTYLSALVEFTNPASSQFIKIPNKNSYSFKRSIYKNIDIALSNLYFENVRILASAGPLSRILCYEYSKKGIVSYDMGNYFRLNLFKSTN